jgi:hypothetical protein
MKTWITIFFLSVSAANFRADTPTSAPDPAQPITRISFPTCPWICKAIESCPCPKNFEMALTGVSRPGQ